MFHRAVNVVEGLAVVAAVVTLAFLFVGRGGDAGDAATGGGAAVYTESCASCHGADGGGVSGPALADGVLVERYPDIDDQIVLITEGRGAMPAFGGSLTAEEIDEVAAYTRDSL